MEAIRLGRFRWVRELKLGILGGMTRKLYLNHHWDRARKKAFLHSFDPVRYAALMLALETLAEENVPGALAELGVFRGETSRVLHQHAPNRRLYLFDTFAGFSPQDLHGRKDDRFRDTDPGLLRRALGNLENVVIREGWFPETSAGLENERFALVVLDADLYDPTWAGLKFFYPRMMPGGYLFIHDYNSDESEGAVRKATREFFRDKPEWIMELPDEGGSAVFRKMDR